MRWFWLGCLVLGVVAWSSGCGTAIVGTTQCQSSDDCSDGQKCVVGNCVSWKVGGGESAVTSENAAELAPGASSTGLSDMGGL